MDLGDGVTLVVLAAAVVALVLAAGVTWWRRRGTASPPSSPPVTRLTPGGIGEELRALHTAGRWPELLRLLDRSLPEWPVSSSLIEVARAVAALERDVAATRGSAVSDVVIDRLRTQTAGVADELWTLADRIVVANRIDSAVLREQLAREDEVLLRLLPAMREAQAGLSELVLVGSGGAGLRRAEGRFRALATTARELQELELGPGPAPR